MSVEEIKEAIRQVMELCDSYQENYTMVSLRRALEVTGNRENADEIIRWVADRGFSYCVDPIIETRAVGIDEIIRPEYSVCFWGPDQLKSRLYCAL